MYGPLHRFTYLVDCDFTLGDIDSILRSYGIRMWGREVEPTSDERAFCVKRAQAIWAEYLLCRAGVPLTCELLDPRNAYYVQKHLHGSMPQPWTKSGIGPHTFIDYAVDWIRQLVRGSRSS